MKKTVLGFLILAAYMTSSCASSNGKGAIESELPNALVEKIASENELKVQDVHVFPQGTLKLQSGYISAIVFEDSIKNCTIYVSAENSLNALFNGAPCEFKGAPELKISRNTEKPDILYSIKLFSPSQGAMADEIVAFYFDTAKKSYCESQSLSSWYQTGNKDMKPDLSDGRCTAEGS
ncbi:hypothetical protein ACQKP7_18340 [Pseudomonas frederiksbergensis]|uniref:hypothetical protein n=1 Tax=Pseudomonas frederiksbergensis TaxID=104087 RepID=UPI003CFD4C84